MKHIFLDAFTCFKKILFVYKYCRKQLPTLSVTIYIICSYFWAFLRCFDFLADVSHLLVCNNKILVIILRKHVFDLSFYIWYSVLVPVFYRLLLCFFTFFRISWMDMVFSECEWRSVGFFNWAFGFMSCFLYIFFIFRLWECCLHIFLRTFRT